MLFAITFPDGAMKRRGEVKSSTEHGTHLTGFFFSLNINEICLKFVCFRFNRRWKRKNVVGWGSGYDRAKIFPKQFSFNLVNREKNKLTFLLSVSST